MIRADDDDRRTIRIEQSIVIDVPIRDVRSHWTRFDWHGEVAGRDVDWIVDFEPLGGARTCITLRIDRNPPGLLERIGCFLGLAASAAASELRRFKTTIETAQHRVARSDLRRHELERFQALTENQGQPAASASIVTSSITAR